MVFGIPDFLAPSSQVSSKFRVKLLSEIGSGSYAKVYQAIRVDENGQTDDSGNSSSAEDRTYYAAKVISLRKAPKDFTQKFLPRELDLCGKIDHPNVVKTYDILSQPSKIVLLMDYAGKGDLLSYCRLIGAMSDKIARPIFKQIINGLEYLHDLQIIHRDLKCENILLCHDDRVLIGDFGFARTFTDGMISQTYCGSAAYAAPELLRGKPYQGYSSDIWSLGCILFVMICHIMPFRDDNMKILASEQRKPPVYPRAITETITPMTTEFIELLLTYDSKRRPTIKKVKVAPWLAQS